MLYKKEILKNMVFLIQKILVIIVKKLENRNQR